MQSNVTAQTYVEGVTVNVVGSGSATFSLTATGQQVTGSGTGQVTLSASGSFDFGYGESGTFNVPQQTMPCSYSITGTVASDETATLSITAQINGPTTLAGTATVTNSDGSQSTEPFEVPMSSLSQLFSGTNTVKLQDGYTNTQSINNGAVSGSLTFRVSRTGSQITDQPTPRDTSNVPLPSGFVMTTEDQANHNFLTNVLHGVQMYTEQAKPFANFATEMAKAQILSNGVATINGVTYQFGVESNERIKVFAESIVTDKAVEVAVDFIKINFPYTAPIFTVKDHLGNVNDAYEVYNTFLEFNKLVNDPDNNARVDIGPFTLTAKLPTSTEGLLNMYPTLQWAKDHQDSIKLLQVNIDPQSKAVTVSECENCVVDLSEGTVTGTVPLLRSVFAIGLAAEEGAEVDSLVQQAAAYENSAVISNVAWVIGSASVIAVVAVVVVVAVRRRKKFSFMSPPPPPDLPPPPP